MEEYPQLFVNDLKVNVLSESLFQVVVQLVVYLQQAFSTSNQILIRDRARGLDFLDVYGDLA
jgi:hypothetical protein